MEASHDITLARLDERSREVDTLKRRVAALEGNPGPAELG